MDINWQDWLERWEAQQAGSIRYREERFEAMLDVVEAVAGTAPTLIDLACGTGAIARRVVQRFPEARVIAVDLDPVLIEIGRRGIVEGGERIQWIEADLGQPDWTTALPDWPVDAVLSTTAIHWLGAGRIVELYREVAGLIRPGGVFLNGDTMNYHASQPTLQRLATTIRQRDTATSTSERWEDWWLALRQEPGLGELFAERDQRFNWRISEREEAIGSTQPRATSVVVPNATFELHQAALLDAGFAEVGVIWQYVNNRVLAGILA